MFGFRPGRRQEGQQFWGITWKSGEYGRNFSHNISLKRGCQGELNLCLNTGVIYITAKPGLQMFMLQPSHIASKCMCHDSIMTANSRTVICHSVLRKPGPLKLFLAFSHSWCTAETPILLYSAWEFVYLFHWVFTTWWDLFELHDKVNCSNLSTSWKEVKFFTFCVCAVLHQSRVGKWWSLLNISLK